MSLRYLLFLFLCAAFDLITSTAGPAPLRISLKPYSPNRSNFLTLQESSSKTMQIVGYEGIQYIATVGIGAKNMTFKLLLDTGTSILWIPDISLTSNAFAEKSKFDCSQSVTCVRNTDSQEAPVNTRSGVVNASRAKDSVTFAKDLIVSEFEIGLATSVLNFEGQNADGVLGLGRSFESSNQYNFIDVLYNRNLTSSRTFSLFLCNNPSADFDSDSELIIDGYNQSRMNSTEFAYVKANSSEWIVKVAGFKINSTAVPLIYKNPPTAFIAINRGYLGLPAPIINSIINSLNKQGMSCTYDLTSFPKCQCSGEMNSFPLLTLTFGNSSENATIDLTIDAYSYVVVTGNSCELEINTISTDDNVWILGNNFLRNYYMMFNMDNNSIGFANVNYVQHKTKSQVFDIIFVGLVFLVAALMLSFWLLVVKSLCIKKRVRTDPDFAERYRASSDDSRIAY